MYREHARVKPGRCDALAYGAYIEGMGGDWAACAEQLRAALRLPCRRSSEVRVGGGHILSSYQQWRMIRVPCGVLLFVKRV